MSVTLSRNGVLTINIAFVAVCVAIVYFRFEEVICWNTIAVATAVAAFWRGRWEGRVVTCAIAVSSAWTYVFWRSYWVTNSEIVMVGDAIEAVVIVAVALRSRLWWPSWCAAFHVMAVLNHILFVASPHMIDRWAYVSGVYIWAWLGLIPLSLGTFDAWRAHGVATAQARLRALPGSTGVRLEG